ncbi:PREDICTED: uncharacterized protein LOC109581170 [Amphimedon queenslandica]|uniref:SUEL-type lectin domain-containing protein n=1 Tax=Amphimedon queenslandica TaxID=400682 RepID=A0A1X7V6H9_AMPQE|nr:PREDICTED: uncharacterized protein LOC109581170 [Amphimedon queenslandica]|eukprot:XP_019850587.1 PREDICTED: uncharacterized protein LOC109581170 [Amphimedon queenslandica]
MKSHWIILLLSLAIATVQSNDQPNPCDYKTCFGNEVCHVVENRLLEFPVAVCVLPDDKAENVNGGTDCKIVTSGTNILNCKTEEEWVAGGEGACADVSMSLRSTEVKHVCHDSSLRRYLQADYVCCPRTQEGGERGEGDDKKHPTPTPPVLTSTPPGAPTPPSQGQKESDKAHTGQPTSSSSGSSTSASSTPTETSVSLSGEDAAGASSYIVPIVIVLAFAFLVLIVSYLIYKKKKKNGKGSAAKKPIDATVLVNPIYDGAADYPDLSNYTEDVLPSPIHEDSD